MFGVHFCSYLSITLNFALCPCPVFFRCCPTKSYILKIKVTSRNGAFVCVCFSVFQEKPEIPPSQAQAQARNMQPDEYSYTASILSLLRNKPFMLLVVSYGGFLPLTRTKHANCSNQPHHF